MTVINYYIIHFHLKACDWINVAVEGYFRANAKRPADDIQLFSVASGNRRPSRSTRIGNHVQKRALRDHYCEADRATRNQSAWKESETEIICRNYTFLTCALKITLQSYTFISNNRASRIKNKDSVQSPLNISELDSSYLSTEQRIKQLA